MSNETTEMWKEHRQYVQKSRWETTNRNAFELRKSGIPGEFKNEDTVFIVRKANWPKVDFWPGSERWLDHGTKKTHWGNVKDFIKFMLDNAHR